MTLIALLILIIHITLITLGCNSEKLKNALEENESMRIKLTVFKLLKAAELSYK